MANFSNEINNMPTQKKQMSHIVAINENLTKYVRVSRENSTVEEDEAVEATECLYDNQDIILDSSCFRDVTISIVEDAETSNLNMEDILDVIIK